MLSARQARTSVICTEFDSVSSSTSITGLIPCRPAHHPQPRRNLRLQRLQQPNIRIRIQALHPAPVPRKAHHRAIVSPRLSQQNSDIRKLALHHIRHIPDQEELARQPFLHDYSSSSCPFSVLSLTTEN